MRVRLEALCLPVRNLEQAVEWYGRLGYSHVYDGQDQQRQRAKVMIGHGQWIQLVSTSRHTNMNFFNNEGYEMFPCTIKMADIHGMHQQLAASGWDAGECIDECGFNFKAYDPDGNRLHLWGGFVGHENMSPNGIETVYIPVADLKSSSDWYIKYFGAVLERPEQYEFHILPSRQTIMLVQISDDKRLKVEAELQKDQYGISLAVDDFDGMMHALQDGGEQIVEVSEDEQGRLQMNITDPSGNMIRVVEDVWIKNNAAVTGEKSLHLQQG